MSRGHRAGAALTTVIVAVGLAGCADRKETDAAKAEPATLVDVKGSDVKQILLTERAAQRLGIELVPVADQGGQAVIPYAAVVYDPEGTTWAFTNPKRLTFVRTPITVASIVGDRAVLSGGPAIGTGVVTVGTAELYGTEQEIGH